MAHIQLAAQKRDPVAAKATRAAGNIPAVMYGPGLEGTENIMVEYQSFRKAFRIAGESTIIELEIEGKTIPTLVHSLDFDPVSGEFEHIDFYAMDMNKEVHTHILLKFIGNAPVVKEKNAILVMSKENVEVKCLPKYLVHDIAVDVSGLVEYHDHVCVKDLPVPEGITILDTPEDTVVTATAPKLEVEEQTPGEDKEGGEEAKAAGEEKEESAESQEG